MASEAKEFKYKISAFLGDFEDRSLLEEQMTKKQALWDLKQTAKEILKTLNLKPRDTLRKNYNTIYNEYSKLIKGE